LRAGRLAAVRGARIDLRQSEAALRHGVVFLQWFSKSCAIHEHTWNVNGVRPVGSGLGCINPLCRSSWVREGSTRRDRDPANIRFHDWHGRNPILGRWNVQMPGDMTITASEMPILCAIKLQLERYRTRVVV
jgi:hypothetical protein